MKAPTAQIFMADFFMDTIEWSVDELGMYWRLLEAQWINGSLPDNITRLARIAGCGTKKFQKGWTTIQVKFVLNGDGRLQNTRLEETREEQRKYRELQAESGKSGATVKWGKVGKPETRSERLRLARKKGTHTKEEFQEMVNYFSGLCVKCGNGDDGVFRDHIVPIYQGGSDGIDNLQPLCRKCNTGKGSENVDYRIIYCKNNGMEMRGKWLKTSGEMPSETSGERVALQSSSSKEEKKIYKRKVPLPKDYKLNSEHIEYAKSKGISEAFADIFEAFCIHHIKQGSKFVDWYAAWQTWIRKKIEIDKKPKGPALDKGIDPDNTAVEEARKDVKNRDPEKTRAHIHNLAEGVTKSIT